MKILITPFITNPQSSTQYYIALNLAYLFVTQGHTVAISADKANNFHHVSLYPAPKPPKNIFQQTKTKRTYEEWMYANGATSEKYLTDDYDCLAQCIKKFQPDLIITLDRLASIMLARKKNIRIWSIVHSDMYKASNHLTKYLPITIWNKNSISKVYTNIVKDALALDQSKYSHFHQKTI